VLVLKNMHRIYEILSIGKQFTFTIYINLFYSKIHVVRF